MFCTQSTEFYLPSGACILQDKLDLRTDIGAFDYNLGCSGYVYGLAFAKSLIHSAPLTAIAFTKGYFGKWGEYIVTIGLLLFAFSTAIAWSYYGDRAVTYLWGTKYVRYYHIVYVIAFFVASFTDTTIVWIFSGVAIAFMTLPNLIGILLLRKDMKETVKKYWKDFEEENPKT